MFFYATWGISQHGNGVSNKAYYSEVGKAHCASQAQTLRELHGFLSSYSAYSSLHSAGAGCPHMYPRGRA